jgi:hypothetical protein
MAFAHGGIEQIDQLDALSAIWILSCIDENPILTYRGIVDRLNLDEKLDVPALVSSRRELFRPGVLKSRLEDWKQQMREGKNLPGWILEIKDGAERTKVIDGLRRSDVFRNQFRVLRNAPKCDLEIIDWGLQHLDRLRKGALEARDEKIKRVSTLILPAGAIITSLFVGLGSLFGSIYLQRMTANDLRELKQYEISFKPKQEGYANLMSALQEVIQATINGNEMKALSEINRMESSFHALEPFLDDRTRVEIFRTLSEFIQFCADEVVKKPPIAGADVNTLQSDRYKTAVQQIAAYKSSFQTRLFDALFPGAAGQEK